MKTSQELITARQLLIICSSSLSTIISKIDFAETPECEEFITKVKGNKLFLGKGWYTLKPNDRSYHILVAILQMSLMHSSLMADLSATIERVLFSLASQIVSVVANDMLLNSSKINISKPATFKQYTHIYETLNVKVPNVVNVYKELKNMTEIAELPANTNTIEPADKFEDRMEEMSINNLFFDNAIGIGNITDDVVRKIKDSVVRVKKIPYDTYIKRLIEGIYNNGFKDSNEPDKYFLAELIDYYETDTTQSYKPKIVGWIFDTSGSMSNEVLAVGLKICIHCVEHYKSKALIVSSDCEVKSVVEVTNAKQIKSVKLVGGGGTNFGPALKEMEKHKPDVVFYFTDGYGEFPEDCSVPVVWVITKPDSMTNNKPKFGTVLYTMDITSKD